MAEKLSSALLGRFWWRENVIGNRRNPARWLKWLLHSLDCFFFSLSEVPFVVLRNNWCSNHYCLHTTSSYELFHCTFILYGKFGSFRSALLMTHLRYVFHTKCGVLKSFSCQVKVWFLLLCLWIASSDLMDSSSLHLMIQHSVWWKAFSHLYILPPLPQQHNPADQHSHTPALQPSHHFQNCFLFHCFSIPPSNFPWVFLSSYFVSLSLVVI